MKQVISIFTILFLFNPSLFAQIKEDTLNNVATTKEINLKLGNKPVNVLIYQRGKDKGVIYFNMHDNENTCVLATKKTIDKLGQGKLAELSHGGKRLITFYIKGIKYRVDPNRIFTPKGIEKTLRWYGAYSQEAQAEVERFSGELIKELITGKKFVVAMHNNFNPKTFSVKDFDPNGGKFGKDGKEIFYNPAMAEGDFYYILDEKHYRYLTSLSFSAVLQNPNTYVDDGSLSSYCTQQGIPYINVEAQEGNLESQIKMLDALQAVLKPYMEESNNHTEEEKED